MSSAPDGTRCRAVIVTALPVEFQEVCEHLVDRVEEIHPKGSVYEKGQFRSIDGTEWEVIVAEIGPGNVAAAAEVERVVGHYCPDVLFFVGVAGGLKDVEIGDVVAGTKVYAYESGKEAAEFRPRPSLHESAYPLVQRAKAEARRGTWRDRIRAGGVSATPRALVGPIAAGEKVVAYSGSDTAQMLARSYGDALAVEMEGYGFLHGAFMHHGLSALLIRGISDRLDGKADADRSGSQVLASKHASAFCFEVLARLGACSGGVGDLSTEGKAIPAVLGRTPGLLSRHENGFKLMREAADIRALAEAPVYPTVDARYIAEMNSARDLLNKGNARAALSFLRPLQSAAERERFDDEFLFRLESNLGAAALVLGEYESAERHFEAALRLKPEDPRAIANCAHAAVMLAQPSVALRHASKAWLLLPSDSYIASVYLRALTAAGSLHEVRRVADENVWMRSDARCALVLALAEFGDRRYSTAEDLGRASLQVDPENPQALELVARSVIVPLQAELEMNPPLPGKLPESTRARANEAASLLGTAIAILENQDNRQLLVVALANRGTVLGLLGRDVEACRDYDRALGLDPGQTSVRVSKARLLLCSGSPHRALEVLEALDAESKRSAWHPLALAYLETQQPRKALQVLEPLWKLKADRSDRIRLAELLLAAYSDLSDSKAAAEVALTLETEFPEDPDAVAAAAEWRASQPGGYDEAIRLFFDALGRAADSRQIDRITLSLAGLYYKNRHFAESADLYGKLVPYFEHPGVFRRYLLSLYYGGSRREALSVAAGKRAGGRAIPLISEVEAHLLEEAGDLPGAERLLLELIELEPDEPDHRIRLAVVRFRLGDQEGSRQVLQGVGVDEVKGSAQQLLALARTRAWLGLDGVLELAFRARRVGFDDAAVHQAYVSLFLHRRREQDGRLDVTQVGPGTTVHLEESGGRVQVFTIVDGLDADLHRGELLASDPVALKLDGRCVGETIILKQTELETVTYTITKVESQYDYAFQETLVNFSTWFPEKRGAFEKVVIDSEGVDKMLRMVDRRNSYVDSVLELYRKNQITLEVFAQLVGRSVIALWSAFREGGGIKIVASSGRDEDARVEEALLASAPELVLDLVALLTFASLGLLTKLKSRFRLATTQFVFDEISDELMMERVSIPRSGSLGRHGLQYVLESAPAIESAERRFFLEDIVNFLKREVDILPAPALLDHPRSAGEGPVGRSALGAILLAKERKALLCCDDFGVRVLAGRTWGVSGVCSQAVVIDLAREHCITEAEHHRAVISLLEGNYTFVRVSERDFRWLIREEGMRLTPRFLKALGALEGPGCTESSAVVVAGNFLRDICMEPELRKTRHLLIDACISSLKHGRRPAIVLSMLDAHIQRLMLMNPEGLADVRRAISLWRKEADLLDGKLPVRDRSNEERGTFFPSGA